MGAGTSLMASEETISLAKIELNKKPSSERPKEFKRVVINLQPIDDDFEKWLIIAADSLKKRVSQYFENQAGDESKRIKIRNKLASEFKDSRVAKYNADFLFFDEFLEEPSQLVSEINDVRISSSVPIASSSVEQLVQDVQLFALEAEHKRLGSKFLGDLAEFIANIDTLDKQTSTSVQQFRGWSNVLLAYLNQEEPEF